MGSAPDVPDLSGPLALDVAKRKRLIAPGDAYPAEFAFRFKRGRFGQVSLLENAIADDPEPSTQIGGRPTRPPKQEGRQVQIPLCSSHKQAPNV